MTNETRERIKYYKEQLPHMKEKLMAAIMMLVIAASVTVTATYAWTTLSTKPEVTSINTTVASNGSLEIALANGTGSAPGKSAEGDSSAAVREDETNALTASNITWGNLINLSDESYGLDKIELRPAAKAGTTGLLNSPLYGVSYGEDGRISSMVTGESFAYTYYNPGTEKFEADFSNEHLGVRAISTITYGSATGDLTYSKLTSGLYELLHNSTQPKYLKMTDRSSEPGATYMAALEGLMQIYAQNVLDGNAVSSLVIANISDNNLNYVTPLYGMMLYFRDNVMHEVADCYVYMANILDLLHEDGTAKGDIYADRDELLADIRSKTLPSYFSELEVNGRTFKETLEEFESDYTKLELYTKESEAGDYSDVDASAREASLGWYSYKALRGDVVTWGEVETIINWVCDINSATLDGNKLSYLKSNIGTILKTKNHVASLNNGAIYRMEERLGVSMSPQINVSVNYIITYSLTADLETSADESDNWEQINSERNAILALNRGIRGDDALAEETYAMAVDLWLRTNAGSKDAQVEVQEPVTLEDGSIERTTLTTYEQAYLTLEGNIKTDVDYVQKMVTDSNGEEQPGYYATYTLDGESTESKTLVFLRYNTYWQVYDGQDVEFETNLKELNGGTLPSDLSYAAAIEEEIVSVIGYEGANRVWAEGEVDSFIESGYDYMDSTTQGGGSCYVFYANSPADQERFLDLLQSMQVVFIDSNGRQIGLAYLDTEHYYAENAKVTVPLVLDENTAVYVGTENLEQEDEKDIYGLMALEKNEATRVTALIYLNGEKLTNDNVLASGEIEGSLNIQFGNKVAYVTETTVETTDAEGNVYSNTTKELSFGTDAVAKEDPELMSQAAKVSALVNGTTEIEQDYNPESLFSAELTVTIEGDLTPKGNTISARFMRAISSTQGVILDPITITENDDGSWSATCTFDKPGTYVLRTVRIDGIDYTLQQPISIILNGSTVNSISCGAIEEGKDRGTIITSDNSASTWMNLGFTTSQSMPGNVKGIFTDENGSQVEVRFVHNDDGITWNGTAKFSNPGVYTIEYVEVDGQIFQLNEEYHRTIEVVLGVKAEVQIDISADELEELREVNEEATATQFTWTQPVTLNTIVELYDGNGNELKGLSDAILYYGRVGGTTDGLDANLTWNASKGYYTGAFDVLSAGTYRFTNITTGTSLIDKVQTAPNIQAMPLHDAYFDKSTTPSMIYAPDYNAAMTVNLAYSFAATKVTATMEDESGNSYSNIVGTMDTTDSWSFVIPDTDASATINQEGKWTLKAVTMYGVYYDGEYYGESGITLDLTSENITTKVINNFYVTLDVGSERSFTNTFMASNEVTDMAVTVADYEGVIEDGISIENLKVSYVLNKNKVTSANYGYESDDLGNEVVEAYAKEERSATEYLMDTMDFVYVGLYDSCTVSLDVKVAGTQYKKNIIMSYTENGKAVSESDLMDKQTGMPYYEVNWNAPEVKITSVSPTSAMEYMPYNSSWDHQSDVVNWISSDKYSAVVYLYCDHDSRSNAMAPTVTLELANIGNKFTNATITVPNSDDEIRGNDQVFTFNSSNTLKSSNTQTIGYASGQSWIWHDNWEKNAAGKQTIEKVTITESSKTWTADLVHDVIINQPEVAPELSFTGLSAYPNATVPDTITTGSGEGVLSNDGSNSMTVTLPEVTWNQESQEAAAKTESARTTTYPKIYYSTVDWTRTYTTYHYNRTLTQYTETSSVSTYNDTYRVVKWIINGNEYNPGETVQIFGMWTATAYVERVGHELKDTETLTRLVEIIKDEDAGTTKKWGSANIKSGYTVNVESANNVYVTETTIEHDWE